MSLIEALRIPNDPQAHMQEIKLPAVEILAPRGPAMRRSSASEPASTGPFVPSAPTT